MSNVNMEALHEERVKAILEKDEAAARKAGKTSFWKAFNENLEGVIADPTYRNTVFLHAVKSLQYATRNQPLTEATTSSAVQTYNKAMLPTIITRVFPKIVATKFIATRQLDVPTQLIQTFRLSRNTTKGGTTAGDEYMDPSKYTRYPTSGTKVWQDGTKVIDPFYSSQKVTESANAGGATLNKSVTYAPYIDGTAVVYVYDSYDPRNAKVYATQVGTNLISAADGTTDLGDATVTNGVLTVTTTATATAAAAALSMTIAGTATFNVEYQYNLERNKNLAEISFKQSKIDVVAKSRKNFAQISAEAIQDLEAYTEGKLDALKELVGGMTESMALEIDLEIIMSMMSKAGKMANWDASYPASTFHGTQYERNQELVHKMNYLANDMAIDFLRGENMFAITHPHVFTMLQNTNEFKMLSTDHKAQGDFEIGAGRDMGQVSNFTVAKAPQFPQSDKILMGFVSKDLTRAPYAYFPFVTYLTPPSIDVLSGDIFSTVVGLQQRYDHQLLMDGASGLGILQVANLYSTGVLS